jgi:hypothetical protein
MEFRHEMITVKEQIRNFVYDDVIVWTRCLETLRCYLLLQNDMQILPFNIAARFQLPFFHEVNLLISFNASLTIIAFMFIFVRGEFCISLFI